MGRWLLAASEEGVMDGVVAMGRSLRNKRTKVIMNAMSFFYLVLLCISFNHD